MSDKIGDPGGFCVLGQFIVPLHNVTPEGTSTCDWCDGVHRVAYRWGGQSWDDIPVAKTLSCGGVRVGQVANSNGRPFRVRVVMRGDKYGLNDCKIYDQDEPMVEFYDAFYAGSDQFGLMGQFVSRYGIGELDGTSKYSRGRLGDEGVGGIDLDGGVGEWFLDAAPAGAALRWAEDRIKARQ